MEMWALVRRATVNGRSPAAADAQATCHDRSPEAREQLGPFPSAAQGSFRRSLARGSVGIRDKVPRDPTRPRRPSPYCRAPMNLSRRRLRLGLVDGHLDRGWLYLGLVVF